MTDGRMAVDKKKTSPTTEAAEEEPLPYMTQELAESLTDDVRSPPTSPPLARPKIRFSNSCFFPLTVSSGGIIAATGLCAQVEIGRKQGLCRQRLP